MNSLERDMGVLPPVSHHDGKGPQSDAPAPEPANKEQQETSNPDGTEIVKKKKKNRKKKKKTTAVVQSDNTAGDVGGAQDPALEKAGELLAAHMSNMEEFMGPEEYEKMRHKLANKFQGTVTQKLMGAAGMIPDLHQPAVRAELVKNIVAKKAGNDADEWTDAQKDAAWRKHMARDDYADSHVLELDTPAPSDHSGDETVQHTSSTSKVASPDRRHTGTPPSIDKPLTEGQLRSKLFREFVDELYALPQSVLPSHYKQAVYFALQESYFRQKKENELDISPEKLAVSKSIEHPPNGGIPSFLKPVPMVLRRPLVAREINGVAVLVADDSESDNSQRHRLCSDSSSDDSDLELSPTFKFGQHPRRAIGHNNPIPSPDFRFRSSPQLEQSSIHSEYLPALSIAQTKDKMGCSAEKPARLDGGEFRVKPVREPKPALKVAQVPRNAAERKIATSPGNSAGNTGLKEKASDLSSENELQRAAEVSLARAIAERKMATSSGVPTGGTPIEKKASGFDSSSKLSRAVEAPLAYNDTAVAKLLRSPHAPARGSSLEREDANPGLENKPSLAVETSLARGTAEHKLTTSSGITAGGTSLEKASDVGSENKLSRAVEAPPAHNDEAVAKLLSSPHAPASGTSLDHEDADLHSVKKSRFAGVVAYARAIAEREIPIPSDIPTGGTPLEKKASDFDSSNTGFEEKASDLSTENKLSRAAGTFLAPAIVERKITASPCIPVAVITYDKKASAVDSENERSLAAPNSPSRNTVERNMDASPDIPFGGYKLGQKASSVGSGKKVSRDIEAPLAHNTVERKMDASPDLPSDGTKLAKKVIGVDSEKKSTLAAKTSLAQSTAEGNVDTSPAIPSGGKKLSKKTSLSGSETKIALSVEDPLARIAVEHMATSPNIPSDGFKREKKASSLSSMAELSRAIEAYMAHGTSVGARLSLLSIAPARGASLEHEDDDWKTDAGSEDGSESAPDKPEPGMLAMEKFGGMLGGLLADVQEFNKTEGAKAAALLAKAPVAAGILSGGSGTATAGVGNAASMTGHGDTEEVDAPFEMDAGWRNMFMGGALIAHMLAVQPGIAMFWENYSLEEMQAFCTDPPVLDRLMQAHLDFVANQNLKKQDEASEEKGAPADSKKGGGKKRKGKKSGGRR